MLIQFGMRQDWLFGAIFLLLPVSALGQTPDTTWQTEAAGRISLTQVGFYRWHGGGISSFALSTGLSAEARRTGQSTEQTHMMRLAYGIVKQNELELRKAEDLIHLRSSVTFLGESQLGSFHPVFTLDVRSQFARGYKYDSKTEQPTTVISDFLSPAMLLQSLGAYHEPAAWVTLQAGVGSKQTVVLHENLRDRYKVSNSSILRAEVGLSGLIQIDAEPFTNVHLTHSLTLFAAFRAADKPDFVSETLITMRVNKWLQINAEYTAQLDRDVSRAVQMKEIVSLGLTFNLLPQRSDTG